MEFNPSHPFELAEFVLERELVRRARAVKDADLLVRDGEHMVQHGAKRRDPGSPGDEDKAALFAAGSGSVKEPSGPSIVTVAPGVSVR